MVIDGYFTGAKIAGTISKMEQGFILYVNAVRPLDVPKLAPTLPSGNKQICFVC